MANEKPIDQLSYEEALVELETIVSQLDTEQKPLEDSIKLFERGQSLSEYCAGLLEKAELRISKLTDNGNEIPFEE
jgi:exodeoxyribonuclease VII small subunit